MRIEISSVTHTGCVRSDNEDAIGVCADLARGYWFPEPCNTSIDLTAHMQAVAVVADGVGGHNDGEVASAMAIDTFREQLTPIDSTTENEDFHAHLSQVLAMADNRILADSVDHPDRRGMGTTLVACWTAHDAAHVMWCGDSRCYRYSPQNGLQLLTHDHTHVQQLVDSGAIAPEDAQQHPESHVITRGCGDLDCPCLPDFADEPLHAGNMLLLCSDGLIACCTDAEIERIMLSHQGDTAACRDALLQAALAAGAPDNVSIVVMTCIDNNNDNASTASTTGCWHKLCRCIKSLFS